jgi:hypothetical protein
LSDGVRQKISLAARHVGRRRGSAGETVSREGIRVKQIAHRNYHHTAADTFDKVDARELNENAAVMAVLAYALADSAETAPR